jgi:hypothetical protein
MKYELLVLAAMTRLESPNTQAIVAATGISERKVQSVVNSLIENLGLNIERKRQGRTFHFSINSWGVFESGKAIQSQHFKESMRLEGHDIASDFDLSLDREQQRQILLNKYSNVNSLEALNG